MYRVIVADDEMLARDRICRYLAQMPGVEVVATVWNGQLAKEYLEHHDVDLIISDIRMPVLDGLELAAWVRNHCPECHVILISVYEDFVYAKKAIQFGVKSYLVKPISSDGLIQAISQLIDERSDFEHRNLYVQNIQFEKNRILTGESLQNPKFCVANHLQGRKGTLFVFEDLRDQLNNRELLPIAFSNILQWSARRCDCSFLEKNGRRYLYVALFSEEAFVPTEDELENRLLRLLGDGFGVSRVGDFSSSRELRALCDSVKDRGEDAIVLIKKYITEHLGSEINRDAAAAYACMAPAYFSRYFKKMTGLSYQEYVQNARMEEAERLLRMGMHIKEVCKLVGYQDRNYFSRLFKKHTGHTPSAYRNIHE